MPHQRKKRKFDERDDPPPPPPPAPEQSGAITPGSGSLGDDESRSSDDESLSSKGIQEFMEVERTIQEQLAELDHLRYLARQQRLWISGLVGEFTACGQSFHLLT
jgi:hypothetical protein